MAFEAKDDDPEVCNEVKAEAVVRGSGLIQSVHDWKKELYVGVAMKCCGDHFPHCIREEHDVGILRFVVGDRGTFDDAYVGSNSEQDSTGPN